MKERIETFKSLMGEYVDDEMMEWLKDIGFFSLPGSINHHSNYEGGLYDHSYEVTKVLLKLTESNNLEWMHERSPYIIGMFHDLCKTDNYKKVNDSFQYNKESILPGHGDKSLILLQKFIQLTPEEIYCIRWHMGAFDEKENWKYYSKSVNKYPNVLWTHTADMIASQILEV